MYLEKINSPEDIKDFTAQQRQALAAEMREAMLKRASVHGGHFGPDFGIVDKIIACLIQLYENIKTLKPYEIRGFEVFSTFWGIYKNGRLVLERG
nr:1-deoxy-D-xylulose-5-phosphate synthase N-terminal domain-containing protein [Selenomonas sp. ND2010]